MTSSLLAALPRAATPSGVAVFTSGRHTLPMQAVHGALDSVRVQPHLPSPLVPIVQFIFQQPGWLLGTEMVLAAIIGALVVHQLWYRRIWMFGWLRSAPRGAQLMFVGANLAVVLIGIGSASYGYHYMMHDNDFCKGCHIFIPSGQAWVRPDTGNYLLVNALEGKHDTLSCHSCHPFEITAQTKEMFFWIADRPQQVPAHGRVPQAVCERCHVQGEAKRDWQRIASTAGHKVHLAADSTKQGGRIQCLTCHARTAHRFIANDTTCTMHGCHSDQSIRLGRMAAAQSDMHCTLCHQFRADAAVNVAADSAKRLMIPGGTQCLACHGMKTITVSFDFTKDPHQARCGSCHNPHRQTRPRDADSTCASCHTKWRDVPFHTGAIHRGVVRPGACTQCHQPHAARVDASDCTGCHREMRARVGGERVLRPPMPFDTGAVLHSSTPPPPSPTRLLHGKGDAPIEEESPWPGDSFSHARHQRLACITCHDPQSRSKLTFEPGRGCQICHHQNPDRNNCSACHTPADLGAPDTLTVTITAATAPPRARTVAFPHARHGSVQCVECHTTPTTLAPATGAITCTSCHARHAAATVDCAACHHGIAAAAHAPPVDAHKACAACHSATTTATLTPTRNLCLTCHATQRDHHASGECTTCHLQATPEQYRPLLDHTVAGR